MNDVKFQHLTLNSTADAGSSTVHYLYVLIGLHENVRMNSISNISLFSKYTVTQEGKQDCKVLHKTPYSYERIQENVLARERI